MTRRELTFKLRIEPEDEATPLSPLVEFVDNAIIDCVTSEGWSISKMHDTKVRDPSRKRKSQYRAKTRGDLE